MKFISLIGNCQTVTLCFYLQQMLDPTRFQISWLLYGNEFNRHLNGQWSKKCLNKIRSYDNIVLEIKRSDYIIYQQVSTSNSNFSNQVILSSMVKKSCKLLKMPSIYLDKKNYDNSLENLRQRENMLEVDLNISKY